MTNYYYFWRKVRPRKLNPFFQMSIISSTPISLYSLAIAIALEGTAHGIIAP
jgi:hypothetical protein